MKYVTSAAIVLLALGGIYLLAKPDTFSGGFLTFLTANSSSTVGTSDAVLVTPSQLQYLKVKNMGSGLISCGFNTTSTTSTAISAANTGLSINPTGSSTEVSFETSDGNLLNKYMHCRADASSIVSIFKY